MALIKCPDCGKEFSDSAKQCPNCGYKPKKNMDINYSLIGGWILSIAGLFFAGWATLLILWMNPWILYDHFVGYIFMLLLGIAAFIAGGFLISKKYKEGKRYAYIIAGVLLLLNIIVAPIQAISLNRQISEYDYAEYTTNAIEDTAITIGEETVTIENTPSDLGYYIGTWEYSQPNNQDGLKSLKIKINGDKTVQALVNSNNGEIIVYGSFNFWEHKNPVQIGMHFNDTEEHINGILYIDHLRIFTGYNDYFGIKWGAIQTESDGKVYLYEESDDAEAKNPNKRVELTKID